LRYKAAAGTAGLALYLKAVCLLTSSQRGGNAGAGSVQKPFNTKESTGDRDGKLYQQINWASECICRAEYLEQWGVDGIQSD